jgi:Sap, sulfolipid-1-addressing protein
MNLAKVLPMTFVMIAGPQILSAIFLATSAGWRRNSVAYITGAALSITAFVSASYFLINGLNDEGGSSDTVYIVILVLLVLAALHTYVKRAESEPPKWMGKLQDADAKFAFKLGFLLLGIFPTDILTSVAVGQSLANDGSPFWHCALFIGLTLFLLAIPLLSLLAFGDRAQAAIPKARDWMNNNSWVVSEAVIGLFIVLTISDLV